MSNKEDLTFYASVLNEAAELIDTMNKRKKDQSVAEVAEQLRKIAETLTNQETTDEQKAQNLIVRLFNFIKSKLGA